MNPTEAIQTGHTYLGIELGSTRIKAVLIGPDDFSPIAAGAHEWDNRLEKGFWTYHLEEDVWTGLQASFGQLSEEVIRMYGVPLTKVGGIGISAMMHGYLVFDKDGQQLASFRTWRNTTTGKAAELLTKAFNFNIPQRWSIAHLYQAILNQESHVKNIDFMTTLAGYVHWKLTGEKEKVLGVGEASGMFPIDSDTIDYNAEMVKKFDDMVRDNGMLKDFDLKRILPRVLNAGERAGTLSEAGARLLDPTGTLKADDDEPIYLCPPEGDAGTGMVATNSVAACTGNVSTGTSVFAMIVLEGKPTCFDHAIDIVTTPDGKQVAMVHCNTCTSDLDAWVDLFKELLETVPTGIFREKKLVEPVLYNALYEAALNGDPDCGGLLSYNCYGGEPIIDDLPDGRPLFVRCPDSKDNRKFTLANFTRMLLYSTMATLKMGMETLMDMDILKDDEVKKVHVDMLMGHGGLFKTKKIGQQLMAAALDVTVAVMESDRSAGEGGAWGIALLAAFSSLKKQDESLEDFLKYKVFSKNKATRVEPNETDKQGFATYMNRYKEGLAIEKAAVENLI